MVVRFGHCRCTVLSCTPRRRVGPRAPRHPLDTVRRTHSVDLSRSKIRSGWWPAGPPPSGGVRVFVDQAVKDRLSADLLRIDVGQGGAGNVAFAVGDALAYALVRPGSVVVHLVVSQDGAQMPLAEDQHAVQRLAAQGADQALADRVHARSLDGGA